MANKFEKRTTCEYCEQPMEATNRNKRFCSDKCRVYWGRENQKEVVEPEKEDTPEPPKPPKEEFSSFKDYQKKKMGLK